MIVIVKVISNENLDSGLRAKVVSVNQNWQVLVCLLTTRGHCSIKNFFQSVGPSGG